MRLYVGGISTETNTFSPVLMDIAQFKKGFWFLGEDVAQTKRTSKETRGVFDYAAEDTDVELIPGFVAHGVTAGPTNEADFRAMQELLLQTLRDAMPVDGVVLNMHGAMQSEQCFDCEGDTFAKVRALVGPDVPITSSFDLHACVTPRWWKCWTAWPASRPTLTPITPAPATMPPEPAPGWYGSR